MPKNIYFGAIYGCDFKNEFEFWSYSEKKCLYDQTNETQEGVMVEKSI